MTQHHTTHATQPLPFTPNETHALTLEALISDITTLWDRAKATGVKSQAEAHFAQHPRARTDRAQALQLRAALRELLGLDALQGTPPFAEPQVTSDEPAELEAEAADDAEPEEEAPEPQDEDAPAEPTPAPDAPPRGGAPAPRTDPAWPDGALGPGLLSALAATLASGDSVQLNLTRAGGQLHVTVTPKRVLGEPGNTAQPLVASGTPAELDAEMLPALGLYAAARQTARDAANELLRRTFDAAEQAKAAKPKAGAAARPGTAQLAEEQRLKQQATLTVQAPEASVITVTEAKGGTQVLQLGSALRFDPQKVTVRAELDGHEPYTTVLTLKAREEKLVQATLKPIEQSALFG